MNDMSLPVVIDRARGYRTAYDCCCEFFPPLSFVVSKVVGTEWLHITYMVCAPTSCVYSYCLRLTGSD